MVIVIMASFNPPAPLAQSTLTAEHFLGKTCAIYGAAGTGKTTAIKHAMFLLKPYVSSIVIFSNQMSTHEYACDPELRAFVHDRVTPEALAQIVDEQTHARATYNPRKVIIFDNCDANLTHLSDDALSTLKMLLHEKRMMCTTLMAMQSDSALPAVLRENVSLSLFMSVRATHIFASRPVNEFASDEIARYEDQLSTLPPFTKFMFADNGLSRVQIDRHTAHKMQ